MQIIRNGFEQKLHCLATNLILLTRLVLKTTYNKRQFALPCAAEQVNWPGSKWPSSVVSLRVTAVSRTNVLPN
jgi:hypothetical protein